MGMLDSISKTPTAYGFESAVETGLLQWYQVEHWQQSGQDPWEALATAQRICCPAFIAWMGGVLCTCLPIPSYPKGPEMSSMGV